MALELTRATSRLGTESAFDVLTKAKALGATGRKVIHLEIGEPDFDTPPQRGPGGRRGNYMAGGNIAGFRKVADAMLDEALI